MALSINYWCLTEFASLNNKCLLFLSCRGSGIQEWLELHASVSRSPKKLYLGWCPELLLGKGFTKPEASAAEVASSCGSWNKASVPLRLLAGALRFKREKWKSFCLLWLSLRSHAQWFLQYLSGYVRSPYFMCLHKRDYLRERAKGWKPGGRDHWGPLWSLTSTAGPQTPKDNAHSFPWANWFIHFHRPPKFCLITESDKSLEGPHMNQVRCRCSSSGYFFFSSVSAAPKYIPFNLETYDLKRHAVRLAPHNAVLEEVTAIRYLGDTFSGECWDISKLKDRLWPFMSPVAKKKVRFPGASESFGDITCSGKMFWALQKCTKGQQPWVEPSKGVCFAAAPSCDANSSAPCTTEFGKAFGFRGYWWWGNILDGQRHEIHRRVIPRTPGCWSKSITSAAENSMLFFF